MSTKHLLNITPLLIFAVIFVSAQVRPGQIDRGGEWLSWSLAQRTTYVDGFITGYLQGSHRACEVADQLFEVGQPHQLGDEQHPSEIPSARCRVRMEEYSKAGYGKGSGPDFSAYVQVITEFYTKHREYQDIPFVDLMNLLGDRHYQTADELYQMAQKGELRPVR